jgi:hypothetical protein
VVVVVCVCVWWWWWGSCAAVVLKGRQQCGEAEPLALAQQELGRIVWGAA